MKNEEVVKKFVDGDTGYSANSVRSRGAVLLSYNAKIAVWDNGTIEVFDGWDGYSPTTSKHFNHLHKALEDADVEWVATHEPEGKGKQKDRWR